MGTTKLEPRDEGVQGLYKARVEDNRDEYEVGRVRVRIPHLHGIPTTDSDNKSLKSSELPWAYPCMPFPCGFDHGSFIIPEVGTYVWVMFEAGDINKPVYIGSVYSSHASSSHTMGKYEDTEGSKEKFIESEGEWVRPAYHGEAPKGTFKEGSKEPNVLTVYKSLKGATIEINEADENESLSIIDRLGQIIKLVSPVTKEANSYNKSRRFARRVDERPGTGGTDILDTEEVSYGKKAVILIKGARDQLLRLVSKKGECRTDLVSREESKGTSAVSLQSGEGKTLLFSNYDGALCYMELNAKKREINIVFEEDGRVYDRFKISRKGFTMYSAKSDLPEIKDEFEENEYEDEEDNIRPDYTHTMKFTDNMEFQYNADRPKRSKFVWNDLDQEGICDNDNDMYPTDEDHDYKG